MSATSAVWLRAPRQCTTLNTLRFQPTVQTVRSEVVYKFNWAGPVVARY
jgi:hypothetical protein